MAIDKSVVQPDRAVTMDKITALVCRGHGRLDPGAHRASGSGQGEPAAAQGLQRRAVDEEADAVTGVGQPRPEPAADRDRKSVV